MATLNLSSLTSGFEGFKSELSTFLQTKDSWRGNIDSSVGETLIEMIAAVGASNEAKIRRARQDVIPETATSDRGIYSLADFQGVRLTRRIPGSCTVLLTSTVAQTLPPFSSFEGGGTSFFNRLPIIFVANIPQTVTLYQGSIVVKNATGIDEDYQLFLSTEDKFLVSDIDVQVKINSFVLKRSLDGVWTLKFTKGFVDRTLPDGKLLIQFGNGFYGSRPSVNDSIQLTYAVTLGKDANRLTLLTNRISSSGYSTISGAFTSNLTGGTNEKEAVVYKNVASPTFGTFGSAVNRSQYINIAFQYPGVVDVATFAQREVNPTALEWMNLFKIVLLTSTVWTAAQKKVFLAFMNEKTMYSGRFFLADPVAVPVNLSIRVYCYNWGDTGAVNIAVQAAITNLFAIRSGSLNYDFYLSDIRAAVQKADPSIEYFEILSPSTDVIVSSRSVDYPVLAEVAAGGTLPASFYFYSVAVQTSAGIVTTKFWEFIQTTGATSAVKLTWDPIPGALNYFVYGRTSSSPVPGLIATVAPALTTYTDTGAVVPGLPPPTQNTSTVQYSTLGTLTVNVLYSTRPARN